MQKGADVFVEDDKAGALGLPPLSEGDPKTIDILMTMGGDGSILRVAHTYTGMSGAILGINLGHLGFMAEVQISELSCCLEDLMRGAYTIQKRTIIDGVSSHGKTFFAINDCVLHRARNPSLVEIAVTVDDLLLNHFEADGIIIATATGSTAYSLAAGGPIVSPDIDAFILTPICPHTISNRPIVINPKKEVRIEYVSQKAPIEFVSDGLQHFEMNPQDHVILKRSHHTFNLVNLNRIDYFSTLRHKLGWAGKLRT
jgi:NAD+ kinase